MISAMEAVPGTYALILKCFEEQTVRIGKLGCFSIQPGHYVYVGSAFGPGGLRARVQRHLKKKKTLRWHIDYLRAKVNLIAVWYTKINQKIECKHADLFQLNGGTITIPGFGSSDCKCNAHLFYFEQAPDFHRFSNSASDRFTHALIFS